MHQSTSHNLGHSKHRKAFHKNKRTNSNQRVCRDINKNADSKIKRRGFNPKLFEVK